MKETLRRLCEQALPIDEERRREGIVWTTLSAAAASHPDLAAAHQRGLGLFTAVVAGIIEAGRARGEVPQTVSPGSAAAVLVAVVDGLTLQGIVEPGADLAADLLAVWATPWIHCFNDARHTTVPHPGGNSMSAYWGPAIGSRRAS